MRAVCADYYWIIVLAGTTVRFGGLMMYWASLVHPHPCVIDTYWASLVHPHPCDRYVLSVPRTSTSVCDRYVLTDPRICSPSCQWRVRHETTANFMRPANQRGPAYVIMVSCHRLMTATATMMISESSKAAVRCCLSVDTPDSDTLTIHCRLNTTLTPSLYTAGQTPLCLNTGLQPSLYICLGNSQQ